MEWTMKTVYLGCAALGGTALVLQTFLLLVSGGGDGDVDAGGDTHLDAGHHHGDSGGTFNLLSLRAIAAFLTFFGLAGWGGLEAGWGTFPTLGAAAGAGLLMLVFVAWLIGSYRRLDSHGNVDPARAVGQSAKVYLRIPARHTGKGKITVSVQGRSLELAATTAGEELATGSEVRIVRQTTPDTFEVEPLN